MIPFLFSKRCESGVHMLTQALNNSNEYKLIYKLGFVIWNKALGIPRGKYGWHTGGFSPETEMDNQNDKPGAALVELRGLDDPQESKQMRLKMEIAIARLLMKIHGEDVSEQQVRGELAEILAKWQGATPEDIREAHEDVEATLAQKQKNTQGLH